MPYTSQLRSPVAHPKRSWISVRFSLSLYVEGFTELFCLWRLPSASDLMVSCGYFVSRNTCCGILTFLITSLIFWWSFNVIIPWNVWDSLCFVNQLLYVHIIFLGSSIFFHQSSSTFSPLCTVTSFLNLSCSTPVIVTSIIWSLLYNEACATPLTHHVLQVPLLYSSQLYFHSGLLCNCALCLISNRLVMNVFTLLFLQWQFYIARVERQIIVTTGFQDRDIHSFEQLLDTCSINLW